ncbi:phosphoadenylyl-sulfate reductase [Salaquimonas pukyongi]|uniref:phosphoadenylyl-sulfate reductase n=1 Tax=Salaquimonas pukyongi TaxID=2712698 RepID=UPI00096BC498|nr:phosphoadenylyl-sulfate reductase [Salaquimonas pukyongi]
MQRDVETRVQETNAAALEAGALFLLEEAIAKKAHGEAALVSSFGSEAAVLLHLASRVDPSVPVLFIDTRMMFAETLDYQQSLAERLGLTDVRRISADSRDLRRGDVFGRLHLSDPDACCNLRKTIPLEQALSGFDCWINGRKRHQAASRSAIRLSEADPSGRLKLNPLAFWERQDIEAYFSRHALPPHPMVAKGFTSIGCAPCTVRVAEGADPRSGRWSGQEKTECGIHIENGVITRPTA